MGSAGMKSYKLEHMATEELRKWAKRYGEKGYRPREKLLKKLVGVPSLADDNDVFVFIISLLTSHFPLSLYDMHVCFN